MTDQEDGDVRRRIVGRVAVVVVAAGVADRPDAKIAVEQAAVAAVWAVPREATPDARQQRAFFGQCHCRTGKASGMLAGVGAPWSSGGESIVSSSAQDAVRKGA